MENINLTSEENKELEKRGFFVKESLSLKDFIYFYLIRSSILFFIITALVLMVPYYLAGIVALVLGWFSIFKMIGSYISLGKLFYSKNQVFEGPPRLLNTKTPFFIKEIQSIIENFKEIEMKRINYAGPLRKKVQRQLSFGKIDYIYYYLFFPILIAVILSKSTYIPLLLLWVLAILIPFLTYLLRQLINHFRPLYAFGNLGEKIQKLTPQIEAQSQLIQSEFQKDMNFGVLHNGFEKLSTTFSRIVELVLKLERIEAKANKGNLFDSKKYIGSLRGDIVSPLNELKKFLEQQRIELVNSQKELSRVRVWGPDATANIELQSKRSESLLQELDTNITALDTMIGKMG